MSQLNPTIPSIRYERDRERVKAIRDYLERNQTVHNRAELEDLLAIIDRQETALRAISKTMGWYFGDTA